MKRKTKLNLFGLFFLMIAFLHTLRLLGGWPVTIGETAIPFWVSWVAIGVSLYFASTAFGMGRRI